MCTGEVCRNEFTCRSFGFSWDRPTDFGFSQFGKKSLVYVIYRWLMGLYFTVSLFYGFGSYEINPWWKWLIFLTHWTFAILSIATLLGAVVALHVYLRYDGNESEKDSYDMPLAYKIYWIFHNISLNAAPVISVIYWLVVFDPEFYEINYPSVTFHAVNIGWTLVDFCFTAVPVRILHAYQAVCYGIIYGIFTLIYWQAGGTDERGNPYVYEVIDYGNDSKTAVAWIAFLIFGLICIHVVWFGLYRLRLLIYRSCGCGQVSPMEPTTRGVNHPI